MGLLDRLFLPKQKRNGSSAVGWLCSPDAYDTLVTSGGYTRFDRCPEVRMAVNLIADTLSNMTIHLMQNTENGDIRIKNGLSRKIDISPCSGMTRKTWMQYIVKDMLLSGNAFVLPVTKSGLITDLIPIPAGSVGVIPNANRTGYTLSYAGKIYQPNQLLHFVANPDQTFPWRGAGFRLELQAAAENLNQAAATKKGFFAKEWKPSVIVKVDSMSEELADETGREKLRDAYLKTSKSGEPWILPAELFDIQTVKPLTLQDLAINDSVKLDKQSVAAVLRVPEFAVGAADYKPETWNWFVATTVMGWASVIQQELTAKLLYDPTLYWRMNPRALYAYDLPELANMGRNLYASGLILGNEVRDWIGLTPLHGLDELVILENYIPAAMIGDQKKLKEEKNDG